MRALEVISIVGIVFALAAGVCFFVDGLQAVALWCQGAAIGCAVSGVTGVG